MHSVRVVLALDLLALVALSQGVAAFAAIPLVGIIVEGALALVWAIVTLPFQVVRLLA